MHAITYGDILVHSEQIRGIMVFFPKLYEHVTYMYEANMLAHAKFHVTVL